MFTFHISSHIIHPSIPGLCNISHFHGLAACHTNRWLQSRSQCWPVSQNHFQCPGLPSCRNLQVECLEKNPGRKCSWCQAACRPGLIHAAFGWRYRRQGSGCCILQRPSILAPLEASQSVVSSCMHKWCCMPSNLYLKCFWTEREQSNNAPLCEQLKAENTRRHSQQQQKWDGWQHNVSDIKNVVWKTCNRTSVSVINNVFIYTSFQSLGLVRFLKYFWKKYLMLIQAAVILWNFYNIKWLFLL